MNVQRVSLVVLILLSACAPAPTERVQVVQPTEPPSYYPHGTGSLWRYLPEGEAEDAQALVQLVQGPTIIEGSRLIAWRTTGRGLETQTYRDYREDGVYLMRESGPGYTTTLSPGVREWPRAGTLRVGSSWGGATTATIIFSDVNKVQPLRLEYRYTVVDKRPVETTAGAFEVFVIAFESTSFGENGRAQETLRQEIWFEPFVGEVRGEHGLFLVETNVPRRGTPAPSSP